MRGRERDDAGSVGLDAPGLVNAGMLWAQRGDLEAAEAVLTRAVRLDPGLAAAHLNLAGVLLQRGAAAAALRHYGIFLASPAVARDRTYVAAGLNAASAALQLRTPDDARALVRGSSALAERLAATDLVALAAQYAEQIDRLTRRAN